VGSSSTLDFEVINPFNDTISVQLFLGRKDKTWDNYLRDINEREKEIDFALTEEAT
jgi:hypothetical protein